MSDLLDCPDENKLLQFLQGHHSAEEAESIEEHIDLCDDCRVLMASLVRHSWIEQTPDLSGDLSDAHEAYEPAPFLAPILPSGFTFGRYRIQELLGMGGMGVVYLAHDPELDRNVALKLVRPQGGDVALYTARLQREAQAMAKLSHPHIVTVYELGECAGQVFLAMEFIEGKTLSEWLQEDTRTTEEIIARFLEVGRGLSFAHEKGVIHRDLKPDNILINAHQQAEVTDFGLSRVLYEQEQHSHTVSPSLDGPAYKTQTGARLGTPAYMAPEQILGQVSDARADQFSFCVALWEALTKQAPFSRTSLDERLQEIQAHRLPTHSSIKPALRDVLVRGLSPHPLDRYPSMDALLTALSEAQHPQAQTPAVRWLWIAAVVLLVGGLIGYGVQKEWLRSPPKHRPLIGQRSSLKRGPERLKTRASTRPSPRTEEHARRLPSKRRIRLLPEHRVERRGLARRRSAKVRPNVPVIRRAVPRRVHTQPKKQRLVFGDEVKMWGAFQRGQLIDVKRHFELFSQEYFRTVKTMRQDSPAHLMYAKALHLRALVSLYEGNRWKAYRYIRRSLTRQQKIFGKEHFALSTSKLLASYIDALGRQYKDAEKGAKDAMSSATQVLGARHSLVAQGRDVVAFVSFQKGMYQDALRVQQAVYQQLKVSKDKTHLLAGLALHNVGLVWTHLKQLKKAESCLTRSLSILKKRLPKHHFLLGIAMYNVSHFMLLQKQDLRVQGTLREATAILHQSMGMTRILTGKAWSLPKLLPTRQSQRAMGLLKGAKALDPELLRRLRQQIRTLWLYQPLVLR